LRQFDTAHFVPAGPEAGADGEQLLLALRNAELQLAESHRQFDSLLRSLSGLFYRCPLTAPWKLSFISEGVEELTGYRAEEFEQQAGWADIILPSDVAAVEKAVDEALAKRRSFAVTYRIIHKSGEVRWVSEQGHPVYDPSGRPVFLEGLITDISGRKQAEQMQKSLAGRWRKTLDTIPQMVWSMAPDGSEEFYNKQWVEFTGRRVGKAYRVPRSELVHPDDRQKALAAWRRSLASGEPYEAQYRLRHVSGAYRWVLSRGSAERDARGHVIRWYGTCTDVHDRVVAQKQLAAHQEFVERLIGASPDSLMLLDTEGRIIFANEAAAKSLAPGETGGLAGQRWSELVPAKVKRDAAKAFAAARRAGTAAQFTARLAGTEDSWWDVIVTPVSDQDNQPRLLVTSRDITHQKLAENQAKWSASHDPLTHLPNRRALHQRLDELVSAGGARANAFALLLLDVDEFKRTNDTLGHDAGDALLCAFAERLKRAARPDDLVARLGGDEFAILLTGVGHEDELKIVADKMFEALREPCLHEGKLLECHASVGAAFYPSHGRSAGDLLKHSDLALYAAKASGRGALKLFQPGMRADMQRRHSMMAVAREALCGGLIVPHYQPKVELGSGRIAGFEALLRWRHPRHGIQAPDTIKAAFEDLTLAAEISDRMIELVIRDVREWLDVGLEFEHVAINAAAAEFRRGDFAERLLDRLEKASVPSRCIQLEVTETVFLGRGAEYVERALRTLSGHGVSIALDDFGTGFASLSHLKQFPVHIIKIDRSFIRDLQLGTGDGAIVDAVINLGKSLQIDVVAEGIETAAQHETLLAMGCKYGQGYLYGKAEPAGIARTIVGSPLLRGKP
jgi:diguanylate cyclase (GGDEF)-like protein/PAS domain S-box-containing protein